MTATDSAPAPAPALRLADDAQRVRRAVLEQHAGRARGILHLGAHLGQEAAAYERLGKPVVWVEGMPAVADELTRRIAARPGQRALCGLLDETDGRQRRLLVSNNANGASSSLFEFGPYGRGAQSLWPQLDLHMVSSVLLSTVTVDTLLAANGVDAAAHDHWVVDLQGAELLALKGASRSLAHCASLLVEVSQVAVYEGGVLWDALRDWLQQQGFVPLWQPALPHDDVLFVREACLERVRREFHSDHYLRHNARRLEHLASLNLPLRGRHVLEVGAGIGDHTSFYVDRGCAVTTTEIRPENLILLEQRFRNEPAVTVRALDMDAPAWPADDRFDVIHCYGLLYHLRDPEGAIRFMAGHGELLLLETCVSPEDRAGVNPVDESARQFSQAFYGTGCRPHEQWVLDTLRRYFRHADLAPTQPDHAEFRRATRAGATGLYRRVFIARHG